MVDAIDWRGYGRHACLKDPLCIGLTASESFPLAWADDFGYHEKDAGLLLTMVS